MERWLYTWEEAEKPKARKSLPQLPENNVVTMWAHPLALSSVRTGEKSTVLSWSTGYKCSQCSFVFKAFDKKGQQLWFTENLGVIILCFNGINDNSFSTRERTQREERQQKWKIKLVLFHFLSTLLVGIKHNILFQIPSSAWTHSSKRKVLITCSSYIHPMQQGFI